MSETRIQCMVMGLSLIFFMTLGCQLAADGMIDLTDRGDLNTRSPILIAHRGGVVSVDAPECSLTAITRAAERSYDMVELDVQASREGVPVVFHDRSLDKACGRPGRIADFVSSELTDTRYLNSQDHILTLDGALGLCRDLNLGVMLDFKSGQKNGVFLKQIDRLILKHHLQHATITISGSEQMRSLMKHVMFTLTSNEMLHLREGRSLQSGQRFWFGLPNQLLPGDVEKLKKAHALIFPAINTFRYPADEHMESAGRDIQRLLKEGVDGFQIDSVYDSNFTKVTQDTATPH